jgi:hypothetical protein
LKKGYGNVINGENYLSNDFISKSKELKKIRREIVKGLNRLKKELRKKRLDIYVKVEKQKEFAESLFIDSTLLNIFYHIKRYPSKRKESPKFGCSSIKNVKISGDPGLFGGGQNTEVSLEFDLKEKKYKIHSKRYSEYGRMILYNEKDEKLFEFKDRYRPTIDDGFAYGYIDSWAPEKINSFIASDWIMDFVELNILINTEEKVEKICTDYEPKKIEKLRKDFGL